MSVAFQASLISPVTGSTDVVATNNCGTVAIGDDSNYSTNTDPACAASLFTNYRTFLLTYYQGANYPLSSIASPPTCTPAYGGSNPSINLTSGDGWYSIVLNTVPTWSASSIPYTQNFHQVWNPTDSNIYTCILSNTSSSSNRPDLSPTIWQKVLPANVATSLYSRYTAQAFFALTCGSASGVPALVNKALCQTDGCNVASFCKNPDFLKAAISFMCLYSVQNASANNIIQFTTATFDVLNNLISCVQPTTQDFTQGNTNQNDYPQ